LRIGDVERFATALQSVPLMVQRKPAMSWTFG
jgi:hypothetical protein